MDKISYKLYKLTYPYICGICGYLHYDKRVVCEECGSTHFLREVNKQDYKVWRRKRR